ncbi:uncharacterized protein LOC133832035 [Humulus lupulus]|uniref:uncharacterized protein LOC133832035 n=1 Tax=Humulus lupulus TaxID=3486 RepID=UPI002B400FA1|nr:uncharacterized protein LOC133832035 [Humulus lupulus]
MSQGKKIQSTVEKNPREENVTDGLLEKDAEPPAFKKLHINIPFAEALEQMPSYVKFMKEILSNMRNTGDYETVALTKECSDILQRKLLQKLRDPGSFTIPCTIWDFECKQALCDLGAHFIVLDMEEDANVPIILGRPFLATRQALIDVQKGELRLTIQGNEVLFNVFKAMPYPRESDSCLLTPKTCIHHYKKKCF